MYTNENTKSLKGEVVLYKKTVEVHLHNDTVWLTQVQIADLFGTQRPAITKHLSNIFKTRELNRYSVCSKMEHTAKDGSRNCILVSDI